MSNQNFDADLGGGGGRRNIFQEGRCPAGTHIVIGEEPPKAFHNGNHMNGLSPPFTEACLTDLAQAAEQARIEERKARKRHMDAIYARRRRVREKVEETELQKEAQDIREMNQKLKEENKELETLLSDAKSKIEGMGEAETEWFQTLQSREASRIEEARAGAKNSDWQPTSSSFNEKQSHIKPAKIPKDPPKAANDGRKRKSAGSSKVGETQVKTATTGDHSTSGKEGARDHTSLECRRAPPARLEGPNLGLLGGVGTGSLLNASSDSAIQAILHQSYLQGLNDAALLNQQQRQRDSALMNAAAQQRDLDQLLSSLHAASRRNPMTATGGDYASMLASATAQHQRPDSTSQLYSMAAAASRLAAPPASAADALNFHNPTESALTAVAALQNLQKLQAPPPSSTAATALAYATQGVTNPLQLQMQLGLLAAYEHMFPPWTDPKRPPDES
jgi:myosin heavy subunit